LIEQLTTKALCVGPIYVDINCLSFPCDEGLPTEQEIAGEYYELVPGGSAVNFARFGHQLGLRTVLAGRVGGGRIGELAVSMLHEAGIEVAVNVDDTSLTDLGLNFVSPSGVSVMAIAGSANKTMSSDELLSFVDDQRENFSHLYLAGSFKMPQLLEDFRKMALSMKARGVTVILDHGRVPPDTPQDVMEATRTLATTVDVYLPSRDEFLLLWDADSLEEAARAVFREHTESNRIVAVKDGAAGAVAFADQGPVSAAAYAVDAKNTVGAGDSFNAGFIVAQSLGLDLSDSLDFACATAAVKISGNDLPTRDAVDKLRAVTLT
jgi:sugar/nucleoside kinase (ribokinase family)